MNKTNKHLLIRHTKRIPQDKVDHLGVFDSMEELAAHVAEIIFPFSQSQVLGIESVAHKKFSSGDFNEMERWRGVVRKLEAGDHVKAISLFNDVSKTYRFEHMMVYHFTSSLEEEE